MSSFGPSTISQTALNLLPDELQEPFLNYCRSRSYDFYNLSELQGNEDSSSVFVLFQVW